MRGERDEDEWRGLHIQVALILTDRLESFSEICSHKTSICREYNKIWQALSDIKK